jgi:hypothetical protein
MSRNQRRDLFGGEIIAVDDDWPPDFVERFWSEYPLHVSKQYAEKTLWRVRQKKMVHWRELIEAVRRYREWLNQGSPRVFRPHPKHASTWLNQKCWTESLPEYKSDKPRSFADIAMGR